MVSFEVKFDDGEHFAYAPTLEEARNIRSKNNFNFLSRSLHIHMTLSSRCIGCRLRNYPVTIKLV